MQFLSRQQPACIKSGPRRYLLEGSFFKRSFESIPAPGRKALGEIGFSTSLETEKKSYSPKTIYWHMLKMEMDWPETSLYVPCELLSILKKYFSTAANTTKQNAAKQLSELICQMRFSKLFNGLVGNVYQISMEAILTKLLLSTRINS